MSEGADQDLDYSNLIRAQTRQVDIDAFKERGMKKVNVINAKKINELISQAVTNIIGRMEDADIQTIKDDKAQIVMDSMDEFKRLFSEQKKEADHQGKLQEEIELLRQALAQQEKQGSSSASNVQVQEISDQVKELKAFIANQIGKSQSNDMTRNVVMERQSQLLEEHFTELKDHLASTQGTNVEKALGEAVDKMTVLLEKQGSNGAGPDALLNAFGELRGDLDKRFTELTSAIRESGSGLREDIKKANAEGLKAEIAALRADLEQKTVAAGAASTEALQAQLAQMQEMMAKGGGGGPSGDLNDIISKLEGSMSRKLAEAGIGKEEVSVDDAYAASGVMLGAAFKDMDNIESNISGLDARKTVDKGGAKKAKGALDALKKLKGKK